MPSHSRQVIYAPRALADRENIQHLGIELWGEDRALMYIADLDRLCAGLGDFPLLGRSRDEVRPGLRSLAVGEHVAYYRVQHDDSIRISRILHGRQEPSDASEI
jgi:toxin ParE1/3/4